MKAYQVKNNAGIDALTLVELSEPQLNTGQVLIRVRATALNYRDTAVIQGMYPGQKLPVIPLSDGAGDVVAIGEGVSRVNVGDRVAGIFFQTWIAGMFEAMNRAIALHQIQPIVDRVFPFSEAQEAYRHLQSGAHFGKIVIQL